jgi:HNH endonuclease
MDNRLCRHCAEVRPLSDFYVRKNGTINPWCKACYRQWYVNRSGGMVNVPCSWCGAEMSATIRRASEPRIFCSRSCKHKDKNKREAEARLSTKPTGRRCMWCGADMPQSMRSDAVFCSAECNSLAHRTMRNWRRRAGLTPTKRQRSEPLPSFIDIAERDKWRCGICRKRVDPALKIPDPMAGSLDHLLPISRGGGNEPSNLQLTHLRCNCMKRAGAANDQLRLI